MPDPFAAALTAALDAASVDCVLVRTPPDDEAARRRVAAALTPLVQDRGAALLVENTRTAGAVGADGVHVAGVGPELAAALSSLKPDRIVGAGALATRDDAMVAGEAGVDYLMFGEADHGVVPPLEDRLERAGWWAEIFQVPCVAWAHDLNEVAALARTGVEFVALCEAVWDDGRGAGAAAREAAAILADAARESAPQEGA